MMIAALATSPAVICGEISAHQAQRLAQVYLSGHITGCGAAKEAIARKRFWEVQVLAGYGATPRGAIQVDRATGFVSYSYGNDHYPTMSPAQLAREEQARKHRSDLTRR
jgi:hypothetical protein